MRAKATLALATALVACFFFTRVTQASTITLTGSSYTENFNGIGSGLPTGVSVDTGATSSSVGVAGTYTSAATSFGDSAGAFKNFASALAPGITSASSVAVQAAATDRALGVRQTATFGDPGAAFIFTIADTLNFQLNSLSLDLQMLSVQGRSTTWTIDYRVGNSGSFTSLGTYPDPGVFGNTPESFTLTAITGLSNQSQNVRFRVVALSASTGANSRDSFGIDNFKLNYTATPTATGAPLPGAAMGGLVLMSGLAAARRRKSLVF